MYLNNDLLRGSGKTVMFDHIHPTQIRLTQVVDELKLCFVDTLVQDGSTPVTISLTDLDGGKIQRRLGAWQTCIDQKICVLLGARKAVIDQSSVEKLGINQLQPPY